MKTYDKILDRISWRREGTDYLARLLMVVPGATIHTLREFMESPEKARAHLHKLDPVSKTFFETQFSLRSTTIPGSKS